MGDRESGGAWRILAFVMVLGGLAGVSIGQAQNLVSYEEIHGFSGGTDDGEYLNDPVIEGKDGRLYGATINGGSVDGGLVFAVAKDGSGYVILHDFTGEATDGISPWGGVIQGHDGRIYGATRKGGAHDAGVVFSLHTNGTDYTILRHFTTNVNEGAYPMNSVIQGSDGRLYGRTISGGTNDGNSIFALNTNGTGYLVLHSFVEVPYWYESYSGLVEGSDGFLYGTTEGDGAFGSGSVFRMRKDGTGFQTLHDFEATATDGGYPLGGVYETREGVLYGTTCYGGPDDYGTLYRINRDGSGYAVLRYFIATNSDGYLPVAPPVEGPGGLLYGTTYFDNVEDCGSVYCVRKDGSGFTFLYRFVWDLHEPAGVNARLTWGSDGALYGTSFIGGSAYSGTVFRVEPVALLGRQTGDHFTVRFEGFASQRYGLDATDQLPPSWTRIATVTNITGAVEWSETAPQPQSRCYRAQILNP